MDKQPKGKYTVKIDLFEGPLDLLLHLIEKEELDICELSLAMICDQYLQYLHVMDELDIQMESSYIVIFAHLLYLKSKYLLPPKPDDKPETLSIDFPEENLDLVQKLKEYKLFKSVSHFLRQKEEEQTLRFSRAVQEEITQEYILEYSTKDLTYKLLKVMNAFNKRNEKLEYQKVTISIPERIKQIYKLIKFKKTLSFIELIEKDHSVFLIITTFLAVLELTRQKKICLVQENSCQDIFIEVRH